MFNAFDCCFCQRQKHIAFQITFTSSHSISGMKGLNHANQKCFAHFFQQVYVFRQIFSRFTYADILLQLFDSISFYKCILEVFNHYLPIVLPSDFLVAGTGKCNFHITARCGCYDFHLSTAGSHIRLFGP